MSGVRRAVVIGIDKYEHGIRKDKDGREEILIKDLQGARRDADEICNILTRDGDFDIDSQKHFLTDKRATADAIRAAISDVFYDTTKGKADIALLYFAGHGKKDYLGNGWLLPHDFIPEAPFVNGIRIQEIKELFLNQKLHINAGILILDCCYSGIAALPGSRGPEGEVEIKNIRDEMQLETDDKKLDTKESGRYILASARSDEQAREKEQTHGMNGEKHVHGLYSFYLIEGLESDGGTCDEFGYVHLDQLMNYLKEKFDGANAQHKPLFYGFGDGTAGDIVLARRAEKVKQELDKRYQEINRCLDIRSPQSLITAFNVLEEIGERGTKKEQDEYSAKIDNSYRTLAEQIYYWWNTNFDAIGRPCGYNNSYILCHEIITKMTFDSVYNMDKRQRGLLLLVMGEILKGCDKDPVPKDMVAQIVKHIGMLDKNMGEAPTVASPNSRATLLSKDGF